MVPWKCGSNSKTIIFSFIVQHSSLITHLEIVRRWMSQNLRLINAGSGNGLVLSDVLLIVSASVKRCWNWKQEIWLWRQCIWKRCLQNGGNAWQHQAITWTYLDLSSMSICGSHPGPISEDVLKASFRKISLKINSQNYFRIFQRPVS